MPIVRRFLAVAVLLGFAALVFYVLRPDSTAPLPADTETAMAALPPVSGPVLLTVSGLDGTRFKDGKVEFDAARLAALGRTEFETSTIWTEGIHRYSGVRLADLLEALGLKGTDAQLEFRALNDYAVEFSAADVTEDAPLLAYLSDGEPMPVRDKGPIWVIYPFDSDAAYRTDTIYSLSIWQLDRIQVMR